MGYERRRENERDQDRRIGWRSKLAQLGLLGISLSLITACSTPIAFSEIAKGAAETGIDQGRSIPDYLIAKPIVETREGVYAVADSLHAEKISLITEPLSVNPASYPSELRLGRARGESAKGLLVFEAPDVNKGSSYYDCNQNQVCESGASYAARVAGRPYSIVDTLGVLHEEPPVGVATDKAGESFRSGDWWVITDKQGNYVDLTGKASDAPIFLPDSLIQPQSKAPKSRLEEEIGIGSYIPQSNSKGYPVRAGEKLLIEGAKVVTQAQSVYTYQSASSPSADLGAFIHEYDAEKRIPAHLRPDPRSPKILLDQADIPNRPSLAVVFGKSYQLSDLNGCRFRAYYAQLANQDNSVTVQGGYWFEFAQTPDSRPLYFLGSNVAMASAGESLVPQPAARGSSQAALEKLGGPVCR